MCGPGALSWRCRKGAPAHCTFAAAILTLFSFPSVVREILNTTASEQAEQCSHMHACRLAGHQSTFIVCSTCGLLLPHAGCPYAGMLGPGAILIGFLNSLAAFPGISKHTSAEHPCSRARWQHCASPAPPPGLSPATTLDVCLQENKASTCLRLLFFGLRRSNGAERAGAVRAKEAADARSRRRQPGQREVSWNVCEGARGLPARMSRQAGGRATLGRRAHRHEWDVRTGETESLGGHEGPRRASAVGWLCSCARLKLAAAKRRGGRGKAGGCTDAGCGGMQGLRGWHTVLGEAHERWINRRVPCLGYNACGTGRRRGRVRQAPGSTGGGRERATGCLCRPRPSRRHPLVEALA